MNLVQELTDQIRSYLDHQSALVELRAWLAGSVPAVDASNEARAHALTDRLWALLAELDYGHRDEASIRAELTGFLALPDVRDYLVWSWEESAAQHVRTAADRQTEQYSSFPVRFTEPGSGVHWSVDIRPAAAFA